MGGENRLFAARVQTPAQEPWGLAKVLKSLAFTDIGLAYSPGVMR
jgi:hypothetical protein